MVEEASLKFRLRKIDETRIYFLDEITTGSKSISAFTLLVCVCVGITSSVVRIEICVITAGTKKYKSITKKKHKKHDKIVFLGKDTFNTIELLNSEVLIYSHISHDKFVSVHNALRGYYEMKKNPEVSVEYTI